MSRPNSARAVTRLSPILITLLGSGCALPILSPGFAFAQEAANAPRKIEISYTGNLPFFLGFGFVRKKGWNLGGACVEVAVRMTDSASAVGEFCGTHQFVEGPNRSRPLKRRLVLSEPRDQQQVDSLHSIRGGMRFSQRTGDHITAFVQGLAGVESGYRHGGSADNTGFSLAGGGGVDINLTNWFAYEVARANFQMARVDGTTVNGLRFGTGPVFRIGETTDQSNGESLQQQP
jgi:hypothetical protein